MLTRQNALHHWLSTQLNQQHFTLTPLAGDASFRRYFRVSCNEHVYIAMDAPPAQETNETFIRIGTFLAANRIQTPQIFAHELNQGFLLLEDFGDELLINHATSGDYQDHYRCALDTLLLLQNCSTSSHPLPVFDASFMFNELMLFKTWFLNQLLNITLTDAEHAFLDNSFHLITSTIMQQPQCVIHRDYHSRNLMLLHNKPSKIGVIDFQDAMIGPFTYDLVSLLKDCYVLWPATTQEQWLTYFHQQLPPAHGWSFDDMRMGFDWCGLQRHLKILGVFSRLHLRDQKPHYLPHIPLTLTHIQQCLSLYAALHALHAFMQKHVITRFERNQLA